MVDFFDLKGDMERVLSLTSARHDLQFVANSSLHYTRDNLRQLC
ncbi:phenylalanyl-tRNA synthetase subunit beta [Actinobacillus equuli]|nr:phenylalanyl-tRNA synthetase subunit beta [Actinobacillus equuli]